MTDAELQLLRLLRERSFRQGTFKLASGDTSDYYVDGKMTEVFSTGAYLIGEIFWERTRERGIDAIGGLEVGAVPLTTATVISYHLHGRPMEGFWVRDKVKGHGTQKVIEGGLKPGMRVAIVEDVVTRGNSVIKAVQEVRALGCEVVLVLVVVDRLSGAEQLFKENAVPAYEAVFTVRDLKGQTDGGGNPA